MRKAERLAALLGIVLGAAGCGDDGAAIDPTCCDELYPVWCARFAVCDPLTFSLSWRDEADCAAEQIAACRAGDDTERICAGRTEPETDACRTALNATPCDELFGSAGLPPECE